jgi:hypothetical protein
MAAVHDLKVANAFKQHIPNLPLLLVAEEVRVNNCLGILLQQSCALHAELQSRHSFEAKLQRCEGDYAQLFDSHIELWRETIAQGLPGIALAKSKAAS